MLYCNDCGEPVPYCTCSWFARKGRKLAALALLALASVPVQAAWVFMYAEPQGGLIYLENASVYRGNGFYRATIYTDYTGAINSDQVCYPNGRDCQYKRLNVMVTYDWGCNNVVRLVVERPEWDSGPVSESFSREGYTAPAPRVLMPAPQPTAPGGSYSIVNSRGLLAVQYVVCRYR